MGYQRHRPLEGASPALSRPFSRFIAVSRLFLVPSVFFFSWSLYRFLFVDRLIFLFFFLFSFVVSRCLDL